VAESIVKLRVDATGATSALKGVQNQSNKLQQSFGGLQTAIAGLGIGLLAKQTVSTTANFQALQIRMKVLTSEFGEFAEVQKLVSKAQDQFNLSIVEATKGITDIFARLRPLGVSLQDIETTFIGFNSIAKVAGLNATEASAAFTQLAQGLGSGRLQGDEFRSIAEQVPQLLKAISDETGIATGKLKDFASKGLLKSDIIIRALSKSAEGLGKQIRDIIDESPAEKFKQLNNELLELQLTIGSKLTPVLADGAVKLAKFIDSFTKFIDSEEGQVALIVLGAAAAIKALSVAAAFVIPQIVALSLNFKTMSIAALAANGALGTSATVAFAAAGGFTKAAVAANAFKIALAKTGIGLVVIALGMLAASIMRAKNFQKEFNDVLEKGSVADLTARINDTKDAIESTRVLLKTLETDGRSAEAKGLVKDIEAANNKLGLLEEALEKAEARELTLEFEKIKKNLNESNKNLNKTNEISKELTEEAKIKKDFELETLEIQKAFDGEQEKELLNLLKINKNLKLKGVEIKKNQEATEKLKEKFMEIGKGIEDGIVSNLTDAVMGTKTLAQAAVSVLNDLKRSLVEVAIQRAVSGLGDRVGGFLGDVFKNLGKRANGGPVSAGGAFLVGEKGPEILQMGSRGGNVIPNKDIGGTTNIVNVSVDASGSAVSGNNQDAQALGNVIAVAIRSELIKEKRAGGLLSR